MLSATKISQRFAASNDPEKQAATRPNHPEYPGTLWRLRKAKRTACKGAQQKE
jgi:hypothetical protein